MIEFRLQQIGENPMIDDNGFMNDSILRLGRNVDLREEHFGSIIYRTKLFNFKEINHFGTLVCRLIQNSPTSIGHLAKTFNSEYDTPISQVEMDLRVFIEPLIAKQFMVQEDQATSTYRIDSAIPGSTFRRIADNLEEKWDALPQQGFYSSPLQFHWEITHQCNLRCIHCYASASPVSANEVDTLNWERCMTLLDTLKYMGVVQINFLGGEPMIEKRFLSLLRRSAELGFDIAFPTNGLLFTREILLELKDIGMEHVTISLDSADPEVFETIRGMKGIFPRVTNNITLAKQLGLGVIINTVLTRMNMYQFEDLIELLISLDVDILKVIDEFPVGRGLANMKKLMLTPEEYHDFYKQMLLDVEPHYRDRLEIRLSPRFALRQELGCGDDPSSTLPLNSISPPSPLPTTSSKVDYRCSAGRSQCFCGADWDIYPCYLFYGEKEFIVGNVLERPFDEIWSDPESFRCFRVPVGSIPECEECGFSSECKGGCRGDAYKFTGDFLAGNPYCWNLNTGE